MNQEEKGYFFDESASERLFLREKFLSTLRWGIIVWLFIWSFIPSSIEIPQFLFYTVLGAWSLYNLFITILVPMRYKTVLSALTFVIDLIIITVGVFVTGGVNSELWPLYVFLIVSTSMIGEIRAELILLGFVSMLYFFSTSFSIASLNYAPIMFSRLCSFFVFGMLSHYIFGVERKFREKAELASKEKTEIYEEVTKQNQETQKKMSETMDLLKKRVIHLEKLFKISSAVSSNMELGHILSSIMDGVKEDLGFDRVGIFEVDEETCIIRGRVGINRDGKTENIDDQVFSLSSKDNNFSKIAFGDLEFFFTEDAESSLPESHKKYMQPGVKHNLVVPMKAKNKVIGMIAVDNVISNRPISQDDMLLLKTFADQAAAALHNARMFGRERETAVRLKKLEELKDHFLSKMSHELKTPLASVKESVNLLVNNVLGAVTPEQGKFLNIAKSNVERLSVLIEEMLDSARIEAKALKLEIGQFDLRSVAEEVVGEIGPQAEKKNIIIKFASENRPVIHADKRKIHRVLSNLAGNAIKYNNTNSEVIIHIDENEKEAFVCVEDHGIGVEQENIGRVFEKFFQIENLMSSNGNGVGLGLFIAKEIVEAHGGHIWVESPGNGLGSKFCITLPKG